MKLAILSDTHGVLRPELFPLLEGIDQILHAGDIGTASLLTELEAFAPVTAVWGNTDSFEVRSRIPEVARRKWEGRSVVVVHGHQFGFPTPEVLADAYPDASLVIFGHTHIPTIARVGGVLVVNPGCCGDRLKGHPPTIVHATLTSQEILTEVVEIRGS
jgi:putative phosphoesterase